ncbi:hypothetical protein C0993_006105 [Termitomyces sp. T159_Od127]|nr:hypothetical protein C0993_006105 [Termitomyces sp. T159_Od127]
MEAGDEHVLKAFRLKMRNDAIAARAIIDPETYEGQNQFQREVADVLRKNIVQGVRTPNAGDALEGQETFRLRLTKDTELGSNDTIKDPPPMERSNRSLRKQGKAAQGHHTSVTDVAPHNDSFAFFSPSHLSMNFSQLKKARKERVVPELKEEDLEENFVRGTSFGNSSLLMELKLDKLANPGLSKAEYSRAKQRERERRRRKKAKKKAADKALQLAAEEEEGDLDVIERQEMVEEAENETEELRQRV